MHKVGQLTNQDVIERNTSGRFAHVMIMGENILIRRSHQSIMVQAKRKTWYQGSGRKEWREEDKIGLECKRREKLKQRNLWRGLVGKQTILIVKIETVEEKIQRHPYPNSTLPNLLQHDRALQEDLIRSGSICCGLRLSTDQ